MILVPVIGAAAFAVWSWQRNLPPTHEQCVAQAEHQLDLLLGDGIAKEANEHPRDYEQLRQSMITPCETYWTRRYVDCRLHASSYAASEACTEVGRLRQ